MSLYLVLLFTAFTMVMAAVHRVRNRAHDRQLIRVWEARDERLAGLDRALSVAQLEAQIAVPLADLVAEAERQVIAEAFPLAGRPQAARVILNSGDSWADGQDVVDAGIVRLYGFPSAVIGPPVSGGGLIALHTGTVLHGTEKPAGDWVEITALGDHERSWIPGPGQRPEPEPDRLAYLRGRRRAIHEQARALAASAPAGDRAFTAEDWNRWNAMNEELRLLDARIDALARAARRLAE